MSAATVLLDTASFNPAAFGSPHLMGRRRTLAEARRGNGEAFAQMVLPYAPGLYRRALRITGSVADAEDAHQEALLKAFSRLDQFAGQQKQDGGQDDLHAWVSRITTNASIDVIRQRREGKLISLEEPCSAPEETFGSHIAARAENPEEQYARREMRLLVARAVARLTPELRRVCLLRDVLQYSTQEVAKRLGISTVAVRLRLFRAHRRLREGLREPLSAHRRVSQRPEVSPTAETTTRRRSQEFPALSAAPGFACGD